MKRLFTVAIMAFFVFSCGEAGLGFNVAKEIGVDAEFAIPGPPIGTNLLTYNPDAEKEATKFELSEVSDGIDDLGELSLNNIAYQIEDVLSDVELDSITIQVELGGQLVTLIKLTGTLQNSTKENVNLTASQYQDLENQLFNQKELDAVVTVDLAEMPDPDGVGLNFRTFYDVTLKIRQD